MPVCYLCAAGGKLTRDHVPPESFFPDPKPKDLITVPCCRRCNESYSLDDEAFRLWITAPPNISEAGKWIQQKKVFESSFKRSPKLVENVKKHIQEIEVDGNKIDLITIPQDRAERFLVRLTKGLLAYFYPEFHRDSQEYRVANLTMLKDGWNGIGILRDHAIYDVRGEGVFQFRRHVELESERGYWMFCFYEASLFIVWHEKRKG